MADYYCDKCKIMHKNDELCPKFKIQLKENPELLAEVANFTAIAGQYHLVTSQTLDNVAQTVNKVVGSNLSYEGTHQMARDIQVFAKLNSDSFSKCGYFANAQTAKDTFENSSSGFKKYLTARLNGTGQEVDWLRMKQGKLSSIIKKSTLPDGNTVGYDGETVFRFFGDNAKKEFITVKSAQGKEGLYTNVKDIVKAIKNGTLGTKDTVVGVKGTKEALNKILDQKIKEAMLSGDTNLANKLEQAKNGLKIQENNNFVGIRKQTDRLIGKIKDGKANTTVTSKEVANGALKGAIIGAAIGITISGITNYIRFRNGEITEDEAFRNVGEDAVKGVVTGAAMGAVTLFLPGLGIGFIGGMAIGIYINEVSTNLLDEIFGKGAYGAILDSAGYTYGMAMNLQDCLKKIERNEQSIINNNRIIFERRQSIDNNFNEFDKFMESL